MEISVVGIRDEGVGVADVGDCDVGGVRGVVDLAGVIGLVCGGGFGEGGGAE